MKKRFMSVLLALVMCLSLLPTAALAAEQELTASTRNLYSHTYKLTEDVTLDDGTNALIVYPGVNATLDLNGHVLTGRGSYVIYYGNNDLSKPATLTLTDSDPTAVHYFTVDSAGRWSLCPTAGHTHDAACRKVTGGCIVGDGANVCVNVNASAKTFIMEGGNLIGGKNNSIGVQVNGSFTMKGGSIQGCSSPSVGSVSVGCGAQITLGGDPAKTVTIEDTSAGKSGVWLNNASPAAKLTVDEMAAVPSFTVSRGSGAKLTYVGDLDLTGAPTTLPTGVSWDSSKNELTLTNVYCGTVKLPCDSTIKGNGYAELIRSDGTIEGNLTFDGATIEVGSIMWHHNDAGPKIILKNGSTLTAIGENGLYAGGYDIQDSSKLVLNGAPISSNSEGVIEDLNDYLPDGKEYYANNEGIAKYLHRTEDSTEGSDRVTNETFRHYCEVKFYPGTRGYLPENVQEITQRVPYGSKVTPPTATPNSPDYVAFTGWKREDNSQAVDTTIDDPITADRVAFTAQYQQFDEEYFNYTNNVVLGGTAKPTAQDFELEVIYSDQSPMNTATVGGNRTQVTATTTFTTTGITQAALTGTLTLKGLSGDIFPCFVRQKDVTADGWMTAAEAYLLAYDTQGEEEEPPTLKIYPAEPGEDAVYHITLNNGIAVSVDSMTFTNRYTGYNVTWSTGYGGDTIDTTGATTSGAVGTTIIAPADPTRPDDASNVYTFDGWYTAAEGGTKLDATATIPTRDVTYYAHWIKTRIYNVTWDVNGGDTPYTPTGATTSGTVGTTIIAPSNAPTRDGYSFDGWYTAAQGGTKLNSATIPQGGVTYYAHWSKNPIYNVTWDVNGGDAPYTPTGATTSGAAGTTIVKPTNPPTRAADANYVYSFDGWYTAAEGGTKLDTTATIPTGGVTYYAHWSKNPIYNVTWDVNGGDAPYTPTGATTSGTAGTTITAPADDPVRSGYSFDGWYTAAQGGTKLDTTATIPARNVTYYAHWTHVAHRFTVENKDAEGALKQAGDCQNEAVYYKSCKVCGKVNIGGSDTFKGEKAPSRHAGSLGGYQMNADGHWKAYTCCTNVREEEGIHTFGADGKCICGAVKYTVTFNANGGEVDPASADTDIYGRLSALPVPTRSGSYEFNGWFTEESGGAKVDAQTIFSGDTSICARWSFTGFTGYPIDIDAGEHGTVKLSHSAASGRVTVIITVLPDAGYSLDTLTVTDKNGSELELNDRGGGKYAFVMPDSKVTVKATFTDGSSAPGSFVDVPRDEYYYDAVNWAVKNGITSGIGDGRFGPDMNCTRAQAVTFLWRAAGSPEPKSAANPFDDVSANAYYARAVRWAAENGITDGVSETKFAPDESCTRAQIVTFLWRASGSAKTAAANPFTDVKADAYYAGAVAWAVKNGITDGVSATEFAPDVTCTRAQIVTMLYRLLAKA